MNSIDDNIEYILDLVAIINEEYKMTHKKVEQYYLVKYESDWADEMTIEGFALLTNKDKDFFDSITEDAFPLTHGVGTNEEIKYEFLDSLLDCYTWITISKREYNLISKLLGTDYGHFFYPELDE